MVLHNMPPLQAQVAALSKQRLEVENYRVDAERSRGLAREHEWRHAATASEHEREMHEMRLKLKGAEQRARDVEAQGRQQLEAERTKWGARVQDLEMQVINLKRDLSNANKRKQGASRAAASASAADAGSHADGDGTTPPQTRAAVAAARGAAGAACARHPGFTTTNAEPKGACHLAFQMRSRSGP